MKIKKSLLFTIFTYALLSGLPFGLEYFINPSPPFNVFTGTITVAILMIPALLLLILYNNAVPGKNTRGVLSAGILATITSLSLIILSVSIMRTQRTNITIFANVYLGFILLAGLITPLIDWLAIRNRSTKKFWQLLFKSISIHAAIYLWMRISVLIIAMGVFFASW